MFNNTEPYNDLPLLPPKADIETKNILKKAITANKAITELKNKANFLPNQNILLSTIALREAKDSSAIENIFTTNDRLYKAAITPEQLLDPATKEVKKYNEALKGYFADKLDKLCPTCRERYYKNPLRILDCKEEGCKALCKDAPKIVDYLCDDCSSHFKKLQELLTDCGVAYEINPFIVRGLDYYTKTVFEFVTTALGSQGTVCGGGRYDNLISELGGTPPCGVGFGMGIERLLMLMEAENVVIPTHENVKLYIASMGDEAYKKAFEIASELRDKGVKAEIDHAGRGIKAQFKYADKIRAENVVTLGDNELLTGVAQIKNMADGKLTEIKISDISSYFAK